MIDKFLSVEEQIKHIQSTFLSLKVGVEFGCNLLIDLLEEDKKSIVLNKDESASIISLIVFDSMIHEDIGYSILQDFEFNNNNEVIVKCEDSNKCKNNLNFIIDYIQYRSEFPVDIGEC